MLEVHEESLAFGLFWLSKLTWPWAGGHGGGLREHLGRNSPKLENFWRGVLFHCGRA
jgi:hypothetical protein